MTGGADLAWPRPEDVERFRAAIARRLGLHFDDGRTNQLAEVLAGRLEITAATALEYVGRLENAHLDPAELRALTGELTVGETYFFRHVEQFNALAEVAWPERMRTRGGVRPPAILSAGCASGEEAYSLAMWLRDRFPNGAASLSVRGVDVNPASIDKAKRAHYSKWSLRETAPDARRRWFRADGKDFLLADEIRQAVRFDVKNLTQDDADLWVPEGYDVIFCRNVVMYFTSHHAEAVIARITQSLARGGYLFLGHAETLRGLSGDFHLCHTHGTFYYRKKDADAYRGPPARWGEDREATSTEIGGSTWMATIDRASSRIEALVAPSPAPPVDERPAAAPERPLMERALDSFKDERYAEALDMLRGLPAESAAAPEALLLQASILVHGGRLDEAERACRVLLAIDELSAGAHYLLALCREGQGDRKGAIDHDQVATYLDPSFAMPHLHIGLCSRRSGDLEAARHELARALALLQREDGSRLLLFGGGFGREALMALCRSELRACGGQP